MSLVGGYADIEDLNVRLDFDSCSGEELCVDRSELGVNSIFFVGVGACSDRTSSQVQS